MRAEEAGAYTGETSPVDGRRGGAVRHPGPLGAAPVRQRDRCGGGGQGRIRGRRTGWCRSRRSASAPRSGAPASPPPSSSDSCAPPISLLPGIAGSGLVVAYEPVWAIGTGDAASGEDAQAAAAQIRAILAESDPAGADEVPILYGGSCTPDNAAEFFAEPDVDGALVGGASLNAERLRADRAAGASKRAGERGRRSAAARRAVRARRLRPRRTTRRATRSCRRGCRPGSASPPSGPPARLEASGEAVGLPAGQMGNSRGRPPQPGRRLPGPAGPAAHQRRDRRRQLLRQPGAARGRSPCARARDAGCTCWA